MLVFLAFLALRIGRERPWPRLGGQFDAALASAGSYSLDALITTTGPVDRLSKGAGVYWPDAGEAAARIGSDGGVVRQATAADTAAGGPPAGTLAVFGEGDKQNARLGWWTAQSDWPNITAEGQLAARAGYFSNLYGSYLRLSGEFAMTGNLNMGGNMIGNLKKVAINAPCDGLDGASPASKAMDGKFATYNAPNATATGDKLGSGYLLTCGYDDIQKGYYWRAASVKAPTVEDIQAGMMDGLETNFEYMCFAAPGGNQPWDGGHIFDTSGINYVKFVIKNGDGWGYLWDDIGKIWRLSGPMQSVATPYSMAGIGRSGGYDLAYDWTSNNQSFGTPSIPIYAPTEFPATGGWGCKSPAVKVNNVIVSGDPNFQAAGGWFMSPAGVYVTVQGQWYHPATKNDAGRAAEDLAGIPVDVTVVNGVSCDPVTGACSVSTAPQTVYTQARGAQTWVTSPIFASYHWSFKNKFKCDLGAPGAPPPLTCAN